MDDRQVECSDLNSLSMSGQEHIGVTSMVQEACEQVDIMPSLKANALLPATGGLTQDILQYFGRPRQIATGSIPLTRTQFLGVSVTSNVILGTWFPFGAGRLNGCIGFRATIVYTLQVNATPFHAGLLGLTAQYGARSINHINLGARPECYTNMHHVKLDLSNNTMVQLRVPYINDTEFMPIANNFGSIYAGAVWHAVAAAPLLPIVLPSGLAAPTFNVYAHLEDIVVLGAGNNAVTTIAAQSSKELAPKNAEFENDAYPFSSSLHAASRSLRFLSRGIPALSSIARVPIWALGQAAGLARYYGYAKPTIQEPPVKMNFLYSAEEHNVDKPSTAIVVGPFASNDLSEGPVFSGTDVDEMSLSYIFGRWSQTCIFELVNTNAAAKPLYAAFNSPSAFWFRFPATSATAAAANLNGRLNVTGSATTYNSFQPTTLFWASSMFQMWRGSIKYRFTFAKTKMHAGRVLCSFAPLCTSMADAGQLILTPAGGSAVGPENALGAIQPWALSAIFDLRDNNVFEFEVPYMSLSAWTYWGQQTGTLSLSVLDPLIASSVVSTSIFCLVEVCGGADFEVAIPVTPRYAPAEQGTIQLQSNKELSTLVPEAANHTIGNKITSLKQLIMIPHTVQLPTLGANQDRVMTAMPWFWRPVPATTSPPAAPPLPSCSLTFGGYIASAFAYVRGGTDVHIYGANITNMLITAWNSPNISNVDLPTASFLAGNGAVNLPSSSIPRVWSAPDAPAHFRFPLHIATARIESAVFNGFPWNPLASDVTSLNPNLASANVTGVSVPLLIPRIGLFNRQNGSSTPVFFNYNASEDARCGVFQGPPPLALVNGATTVAGPYDPDTLLYQALPPAAALAAQNLPVAAQAPLLDASQTASRSLPTLTVSIPQSSTITSTEAGDFASVVNSEVPLMGPPPSPSVVRSRQRAAMVDSILETAKAALKSHQ